MACNANIFSIFGTLVVYGLKMTAQELYCWYGLGDKSQGERVLKKLLDLFGDIYCGGSYCFDEFTSLTH